MIYGLLIGLIIGAIVGYLLAKTKSDALAAQVKMYEGQLAGQMALLREQMNSQSERILKERSQELERQGRAVLDTQMTSINSQLSEILNPLKDGILQMREAVEKSGREHSETMVRLDATIKSSIEQSRVVGERADRLAEALTGENKTQGNFGELRLKQLLEDMGLEEGVQFEEQVTIRDAQGRAIYSSDDSDGGSRSRMIPDVILHFPDHRDVIIDSKMSFKAFEDYHNATTDAERQDALNRHVLSVRQHVNELARKNYSAYNKEGRGQLDFVLMYVFSESALQLALTSDATLWKDAYDKGVIISGSQNLYMMLRVLEMTWRQVRQVENQENMMKAANTVIDRVQMFYERFMAVDDQLNRTRKAFDDLKVVTDSQGRSIEVAARQLISYGAKENSKRKYSMKEKTTGAIAMVAMLMMCGQALAQNPICPEGTFLSDPAARSLSDGSLYVYGSQDDNALQWCSPNLGVLSTADTKSWHLQSPIYTAQQAGTNAPLWAPDMFEKGGKFYLFYCTPDPAHKEAVAVGDSPAGPFARPKVYTECKGIDPSILRDDDGTLYYFWGQKSLYGARMKADLSGFVEGTTHQGIINHREHYFHEGIQAFKRGGLYYLVYADESRRKPSCLGYSTATSPFGPYTYRGVIIDNNGCNSVIWNNHGCVIEHNGEWYVVYHRPTNGMKTMRKACMERIEFDADGLIQEVEMTSQGIGDPLDAYQPTEARLACWMKGNVRISTMPGGQELLTGIVNGDVACWKYLTFDATPTKVELTVTPQHGGDIIFYADSLDTKPLGTVHIPTGETNGSVYKTIKADLDGAATLSPGKHALYMQFRGDQNIDLFMVDSFKFGK